MMMEGSGIFLRISSHGGSLGMVASVVVVDARFGETWLRK
jgi:hypothetical protein